MTNFILTDITSNVNKVSKNVIGGVFSLELLDNGNLACGCNNRIEIWDLISFILVKSLTDSGSMG